MSDSRQRWVAGLRLLSGVAWLVLAIALFGRPLDAALGHRMAPVFEAVGVDHVLGDAPARGFLLQVNSSPAGARVIVAGQERGQTPALINVVCRQGEPVTLVVELAGRPAVEKEVECREGGRLVADIPLPASR